MAPLSVNDASGRYGGGLLGGGHQNRRMVDRSSCDELNRETEEFYRNIPANLVNITRIVPYPVQTIVAKYEAVLVDKKQKVKEEKEWVNQEFTIFWLILQIHYSICFSLSCSEEELWQILEYNPILGFSSSAVKNVTLLDVRILKENLSIDPHSPNIIYLM